MATLERCAVCHAEYESHRQWSMYCSPACKMKAWRRRQGATAAATRDLLQRQTEAIAAGADRTVMESLAREATTLLGDLHRV